MAISRDDGRSELQVEDFRRADSVRDIFPEKDPEDAYLTAKRVWHDVYADEPPRERDGLPGDAVVLDDYTVLVHGVPHNAVGEEEEYVTEAVQSWVQADERVFFEQGVYRKWIEDDLSGVLEKGPQEDMVEEMDDYAWAEEQVGMIDHRPPKMDPVTRKAVEATNLEKTRAASEDKDALADLQHHYRRSLLPVHLEREWLQERYPHQDVVRHGRSEEMADYVVNYMEDKDTDTVHVVVGAGHQPAVVEYLQQYRDGERQVDPGFAFHGDSTQAKARAAEMQDYDAITGYREENGTPVLSHDHDWDVDAYASTLEWYAEWELGGDGEYEAVIDLSDAEDAAAAVTLRYMDDRGEVDALARIGLGADTYRLAPIRSAKAFPVDHENGLDNPLDDAEAAFLLNALEEYLHNIS